MISRILAAVDESLHAAGVVDMAIELADRFESQIHLFRIVDKTPEFPPAAATHYEDGLDAYLVENARADLRRLSRGHPRISVLDPVVSGGDPWKVITAEAERIDAQLIMIGSHHFGGWDRLLGTTSGRIAAHASRHVFVVHVPRS